VRAWPAIEIDHIADADLLQAALLDYEVAAIEERTADSWRVFFQSAADRDRAAAALARDFPEISVAAVDVPDEDWAARSQASLRAIQIGNLVVAPPWDVPENSLVVVIQPSMGFGTGHHATTRLCLAALQALDVRGRSVIDVGTGSGVLAIAARLLGADRVAAIDDDPDAIQAARENVTLNDGARVDVRLTDVRASGIETFDIVVANLTGGLLIQTAPVLQQLTTDGGAIVLSGFMRHEVDDVLAAFAPLRVHARTEEDEWICVTVRWH
jgi:ribosomal protein L11 methyltransferase